MTTKNNSQWYEIEDRSKPKPNELPTKEDGDQDGLVLWRVGACSAFPYKLAHWHEHSTAYDAWMSIK